MIFNNSVTVYHAMEGGFEKSFYLRASVSSEDLIEARRGGRVSASKINVRIFTEKASPITAGDRLVIGKSDSAEPPKDSHIIMSAVPNMRGSRGMRHYRIYAV